MVSRLTLATLLLLLSACGTTRVVRLDTGEGAPLEYRPPTWSNSVEVDAGPFEKALTRLVLEEPLTLRSSHFTTPRTSSRWKKRCTPV